MQKPSKIELPMLVVIVLLMLLFTIPVIYGDNNDRIKADSPSATLASNRAD